MSRKLAQSCVLPEGLRTCVSRKLAQACVPGCQHKTRLAWASVNLEAIKGMHQEGLPDAHMLLEGPVSGEPFKDVNSLIHLAEKIVHSEEPIMTFACLKDNLGFPGGCEDG